MRKMSSLFVISAVFLALIFSEGCAKKVATTTQAVEVKEKPVAPPPQEDFTKEQPPAVVEQPILKESSSGTLADIYFDFDRSEIRPDAKQVLQENARWFKTNSRGRLKVEGNCDERGTTEYNLALGQRRAEAAKRFLVALGVEASRISTISYGEERPVCTDHQEDCWSKNRRDHFAVESK